MPVHDPVKTQSPGAIGEPLRLQEVQDGLTTRRLGKLLHYFSQINSTNSYARLLAEQGADEGEVVVAEAQTHGRGRLSRSWVSPPFLNLYCSVILRPKLPPVHAPQLTLMAAVALAETVASFIATEPAIKWPNDILVGGKETRRNLDRIVVSGRPDRIRHPWDRRQSELPGCADARYYSRSSDFYYKFDAKQREPRVVCAEIDSRPRPVLWRTRGSGFWCHCAALGGTFWVAGKESPSRDGGWDSDRNRPGYRSGRCSHRGRRATGAAADCRG